MSIAKEIRSGIWIDLLVQLFANHDVYAKNASVTDEVSAAERLGQKIALVLNDDFNFKITYPRDLPVADFILRERAKDRRFKGK